MGAEHIPESGISLKRNAVGTLQGVFQSFSFVGPAADVAILLLGTVLFAGISTPLAIIFAWLIYGLWMITPYEFSKHKSNAGSYYAYSASSTRKGSLGPLALFSWMGENFSGQSFGILGLAAFLFAISTTISGIPYIWVLFAVIITAYMFILPFLGIRISLNYVAITGLIELLILVVGAILIIFEVGPANSFTPFTIPAGTVSAVFFGIVFSIVDFTGLGTVTTISEEIKDSKKRVKKALIISWLLSGLALIPASYALTVGWISRIGAISTYASAPDPGLIVFERFLGPIGFALLAIFTVNSYFSYGVAKTNAVSRIWYSAARDGIIFPRWVSRLHPKYRTPANAMSLWLGISFILDMVLGVFLGPVNAALVLLTMAGIYIICVHIIANTALTFFSHTQLRKSGQSSMLLHYIAPSIASVIGAVVIIFSVQSTYSSYVALPNTIDLAYLVAVVVSLVWVVVFGPIISLYYMRAKPEVAARAGTYDSDVAEGIK
jgi:amino acid transporter